MDNQKRELINKVESAAKKQKVVTLVVEHILLNTHGITDDVIIFATTIKHNFKTSREG